MELGLVVYLVHNLRSHIIQVTACVLRLNNWVSVGKNASQKKYLIGLLFFETLSILPFIVNP